MGYLLAILLLCGCYGDHCVSEQDMTLGAIGLYTNPSPLGGVPSGACKQAEDIVVRRKGRVECRPGVGATWATGDGGIGAQTPLAQIYRLIPYNQTFLAIGKVNAGSTTYWEDNSAVHLEDGATNPTWTRYAVRGVEARQNLYVTTDDCVRKLTGRFDVTMHRAGMMAPVVTQVGFIAGTMLPDTSRVAYRALLRRKDANGVVIRSEPSGRIVVTNTSGGATNLRAYVAWNLNSDVAVGDAVELYRTRTTASSVFPSDELFYVEERVLVAGDITVGFVTMDDTTADDFLEAALYTNESRESFENANERPARARDVALFRGSLFTADLMYPAQATIRYTNHAIISTSTGIGRREYTGRRTNGSNQLTLMSSIVGIKVGQMLIISAMGGPTSWSSVPVLVTAASGTTITLSATWTGASDGANVTCPIEDTLRIKVASGSHGAKDRYYPMSDITTMLNGLLIDTGDASLYAGVTASEYVSASMIGDSLEAVNGFAIVGINRQLLLRQMLPSDPVFELFATHGSEYDPALPEPTVGTGYSATQDVLANGIAWSKSNEPEHFSLLDIEQIGGERAHVLRIEDTKDALWVFKTDGIWRVTGAGRDAGFRIDPYDPTYHLIHPDALCKLDDAIYAWTDRGIIRVSDAAGVERLSEDPISDQFALMQQKLGPGNITACGCYAVANPKNHEVIFGIPTQTFSDPDTAQAPAFVYNAQQQTWVRWFAQDTTTYQFCCAAYMPEKGVFILGSRSRDVWQERKLDDPFLNGDRDYKVTVASVFNTTTFRVTINAGSGWTPAIGDALVQGGVNYLVTDITSATVFFVHQIGVAAGISGGVTGITSTIEMVANVAKNPNVLKHWHRGAWVFGSLAGIRTFTMQWRSDLSSGSTSLTRTIAKDGTFTYQAPRFIVPKDQGRCVALFPLIQIRQALSDWTIEGLSLFYDIMGDSTATRTA